ncbi:MAG: xylulokinase [Eubacteriales bacterium]|jgi:xylulokinase
MYFIGIDLGTSAVKLLLMDEKGGIKNIVSKEYPLSFPHPGWSEQNPEDWIKAIREGIPELVSGIDAGEVKGIGAGGQMHGLVVLDKDDNVIRPAILWNDGRTQDETAYLNNVIGKAKLTELTGNIAFAGFTAPKILWMKKNEPENFARIARIMLPKDYVNYMLTGVHCTDYSDASGMLLLDVKNKRWSQEMLKICGITEAQMPKLFESYEKVGTLKEDAAEALGLPEGVIVAAGAGDNAAAAVGTGVVGNGGCNISLGTSGTIFISSDTFRVDSANALHSFAHADGAYHLMGCMLSAASCNKWWMDEIIGTQDYAAQQEGITDEMLGNNHVYYLPYLMGERAPHNDSRARSCFLGMTMDTTRKDMTQAVLEGVAFGIRDSLEAAKNLGIDVPRSMICGGGAKSPLWKKIFANVLNIELTIPETEQGPGYGGAILAAVAAGVYPSVIEADKKLIRVNGTVEPDPEIAARYEKKYQVYHSLYPALKDLFPTF